MFAAFQPAPLGKLLDTRGPKDIVVAAMMGAEEYGFGSVAMIAEGGLGFALGFLDVFVFKIMAFWRDYSIF